MPNSNCGRNAWSNMVKGLERWRLGASRPRSMPDQLWGTAGLSQRCAARQSGGHTEAYGEAASPALTNRIRKQQSPVSPSLAQDGVRQPLWPGGQTRPLEWQCPRG